MEKPATKLLDQVEPGTVGTIARVWDTDSEMLRYLTDHGMTLGTRIEVVERRPFGGPLVVLVGEPAEAETHFIGGEIAGTLSIRI